MLGLAPGAVGRVGLPSMKGAGSPALALDMTQSLDSRITFARASKYASYFDSTGVLQIAPAQVPRIDYGPTPSGTVNKFRNNTNVGASVGVPPTNWFMDGTPIDGLTTAVVGVGTENGVPYIDVRWQGTTTAGSGRIVASPEHTTAFPCYPGTNVCTSFYLSLVGGTLNNVTFAIRHSFRTIANTQYNAATSSNLAIGTGPVSTQRYSDTKSDSNAALCLATGLLVVNYSSGVAVDFTLRIGGAQCEVGVTTPGPLVLTSGAIASSGGSALGLLIEESRSNYVRNPRCEGAIVGTPGTLPTNWAQANNTSIVPAVVGSGYENGIPYVDLRFVGTATGTNNNLLPETRGIAPAVQGQWVAASFYYRLVAGSLTNVTSLQLGIIETDASQLQVTAGQVPITTPANAPLSSQRASYLRQVNSSLTVAAQLLIQVQPASGQAIDVTLRIGAPQLELCAFAIVATSPMLPDAGTIEVSARQGETATVANGGSYYSSAATTLMVEAIMSNAMTGGNPGALVRFEDGFTGNNRFQLAIASLTPYGQSNSISGGEAGTVTVNVPFKFAAALNAARYASSLNGAAVTVKGASVMPTGITTLKVETGGASLVTANGWIRRVRAWKRTLSDTELRAVTT